MRKNTFFYLPYKECSVVKNHLTCYLPWVGTWGQFQQHSMHSFYVCKLPTQLFLCLHFGFVLYWRMTVGSKAAHRTLVNLTPCRKYFVKFSEHLIKNHCNESKLKSIFQKSFFLIYFKKRMNLHYFHLRNTAKLNLNEHSGSAKILIVKTKTQGYSPVDFSSQIKISDLKF